MVITMRVHLAGAVDVEAIRKALALALRRHPLLRSTCEGKWWPRWVVSEDCEPTLTILEFDNNLPTGCPERPIDLTSETGAVFELRTSPGQAVLLAWFHHQCVDGIGALQFLRDTFAAYDACVRNATTELQPLPIPNRSVAKQTIGSVAQAIRIGVPIFRHKCARLGHWQDVAKPPANILHSRVLSGPTARRLRKTANRTGVSLNDFCMSAFLAQLMETFPNAPREVFRVLVPVNRRTPTDEVAAANVISFLFQSYRPDEIANADALPKLVHRQTDSALRTDIGRSVLLFFQLAAHVPGAYRLFRAVQSRFATAVFANVGDLKRIFDHRFERDRGRVVAGNLVIERIDGVAPLRENTNLAVSCGRYAGELIFNLRANPQFIAEADAITFLDQFARRLKAMAESNAPVTEQDRGAEVLAFPDPVQQRRAA